MMRRFALFAFSVLLLLPFLSLAEQTILAGFPVQSIWVSKESAVAGEQVEVFTAIQNGSETAIRGKLVFTADGKRIAEKQFELASGKTELQSALWTAEAGTHKLGASIEGAANAKSEALSISNKNAGEIEIKVANPPPPSALEQGVKVVGTVAKDVASTSIPIISSVVKTVLRATESFRESGIEFAEEQLSKQPPSAPASAKNSSPSTAGTTSSTTAQTDISADQQQNDSFLSRLSQLAAPAIIFAFGNRPIFYFLLVLLLLGFLYFLGRLANKPRY